MKPRPRVEGRGSGDKEKQAEKSQRTFGLPDARTQASALPPALLIAWWAELRRRLDRAEALLFLGLPDVGFDLLSDEIHRFRQACRDAALTGRRAVA